MSEHSVHALDCDMDEDCSCSFMTLSERHAANLRARREAADLSPERLAAIAWPADAAASGDPKKWARTTGGARVRAIETFKRKLSSPFADDLAAALGLDVEFFGLPVEAE